MVFFCFTKFCLVSRDFHFTAAFFVVVEDCDLGGRKMWISIPPLVDSPNWPFGITARFLIGLLKWKPNHFWVPPNWTSPPIAFFVSPENFDHGQLVGWSFVRGVRGGTWYTQGSQKRVFFLQRGFGSMPIYIWPDPKAAFFFWANWPNHRFRLLAGYHGE